jgi:hypothetical protein
MPMKKKGDPVSAISALPPSTPPSPPIQPLEEDVPMDEYDAAVLALAQEKLNVAQLQVQLAQLQVQLRQRDLDASVAQLRPKYEISGKYSLVSFDPSKKIATRRPR